MIFFHQGYLPNFLFLSFEVHRLSEYRCRLSLYFHIPREVGGGSPFGAGAEHVASVVGSYDRMHAAVVAGLLAAAHELFAVQGRRHKVRFERTE